MSSNPVCTNKNKAPDTPRLHDSLIVKIKKAKKIVSVAYACPQTSTITSVCGIKLEATFRGPVVLETRMTAGHHRAPANRQTPAVPCCHNPHRTNPAFLLTGQVCPATINAEMHAMAHRPRHLPCVAVLVWIDWNKINVVQGLTDC